MTTILKTSMLFLCVLLVASLGSAEAQPELTAENSFLPLVGQVATVTQFDADSPADLTSTITLTGENVVWDLSAAAFGTPSNLDSEYREPPFDDIPGWIVFDNLPYEKPNVGNIILGVVDEEFADSVEIAFFSLLDDDQILAYGFSASVDVDDDDVADVIAVANEPPELQFAFPTTFGSEWMTEVTQHFIVIDLSQFTATVTKANKVTGWGMLKTPMGEVEALQLERITSITTFGVTTTTRSIEFLSPLQEAAGKTGALVALSAQATLSDAGTATSVSFSTIEVDGDGGGSPTASERIDEVPGNFEIHANYPNPFNPSTTLKYSVAASGRVVMTVHDLHGRQVDTVVDEVLSAGTYSVNWDARDLSSGMYQVRMTMDGEVQARSVVLQK